MNPPKFSPLSESEHRWKNSQLDAARAFISDFSPSDAWNPIRLEALDRAWSAWLPCAKEKGSINDYINAFGVAFGEILVESEVFSWTVVSDEYGTDLGILALKDRGDVLVVPANFTVKRWEKKESGFFAHGYSSILSYVEETNANWSEMK